MELTNWYDNQYAGEVTDLWGTETYTNIRLFT